MYTEFSHLFSGKLLRLLKHSLARGEFPESVRTGDIIFLYKKDEVRDVRNYRPITLLNTDYKILAKVLVARMKPVMDDIVSKQQLGFVPGRVITEATHMLKLVQAMLDETDGEGIIVAADWEKAFDRVSWDFLHAAAEALGFGPKVRGWFRTMYNDNAPPVRRVRVNGVHSDAFHIRSGVPQGCPVSPLIFLLVAEALTRAILDEPSSKLRGIDIGGSEVRITQFADDTQLVLAGYKYLRTVWNILLEYEEVSGMRANVNKFEGIRCGRLKRKPVPIVSELRTNAIKWVSDGEFVRILGIPFWESYDPNGLTSFGPKNTGQRSVCLQLGTDTASHLWGATWCSTPCSSAGSVTWRKPCQCPTTYRTRSSQTCKRSCGAKTPFRDPNGDHKGR